MKLVMVVERPTQFEAPLFLHATGDTEHQLRVLYTDPAAGAPVHDPELSRKVSWGDDLLAGHDHAVAPHHGRARWLRNELRERLDLVIVNGYTRAPYLQAAAIARRAGSPVALRLDSVGFDDGTGLRPRVKRLLLRLANGRVFAAFFGVGTLTLDYLRRAGIPDGRTALLPYPVDEARFRNGARAALPRRAAQRAEWEIPATAPVVLAVAKLHAREVPWDLLRAWRDAAGEDRWLLIAGDGPERAAVEAYVAGEQLPRVKLLGYVPYQDLAALYAATDLFVHAPREERWGVSVGEALASGLPVVTSTRVGAGHDLLVAGENGFLYPAGNAAALVARIDEALHLDPRGVAARSAEVLPAWGPEATWRSMVATARRLAEQR